MRTSGIVRKVDELGRVVLPVEMRRVLGIAEKDELEISLEGEGITLRKRKVACVFCGGTEDVLLFGDRKLCRHCLERLKKL